MDDPVALWVLTATLAGSGAALVLVGVKQRAGALKRNWLVGLRTWETMRDDESWHAAHAATGALIVTAGAVSLAAGVLLPILRPSEPAAALLLLGSLGVTLVLVLVAGFRGHRIAKATSPETEHHD